ncbi:hypothetical protein JTB14_000641 [Gonioctena quinquepunctata]|nr:hypothetical protein JTB14_000641 [Gonioctena quinquepunctata]
MESLILYESKVDLELVESEFEFWKIYWQKKSDVDKPSCAIEALGECNSELFPNIFKLLHILSSLPVTTSIAERSFSTLRRVKAYLRNSCDQDRLTGLALMSVHREINIATEDVISEFAIKKNRRLVFVL